MYELARRGYQVQITDSRFPKYDLLVVSPSGKHYAFVFVPQEGLPRVFIMNSKETMRLWKKYRDNAIKRTLKIQGRFKDPGIWGLRWTQPIKFENNYDALPK